MPATEIPPRNVPSAHVSQPADSADFYDARRWESAYREMHDVPALLVHLQDELDRSRKREAFWMSVFAHLILVLLIVNSPHLAKYFPGHRLLIAPQDWSHQKD